MMSTHPHAATPAIPTDGDHAMLVDRRSLLTSSMMATFAAAIVDGLTAAPAEARQAAVGRPAAPKVRCVITGNNAEGKSCVVSDKMFDPGRIWNTSGKEPVGVLSPGSATALLPSTRPEIEPSSGGTIALVTDFQPSVEPKPNLKNREGFHRTATIDYFFIMTGEVTLLLDTEEVPLKAGDVLIQRNTYHSWRNDKSIPSRAFLIMARA